MSVQRTYHIWWTALLACGLVLELIAIHRRGDGDTLSEQVWAVALHWPGAILFAVIGWLFLWHFPFGRHRSISWPDLLAAAVGIAVWLVARNNNPRA